MQYLSHDQEEDFLLHTMGLKLDTPPRDGAAPTVDSLSSAEERLATAQRLASSSQATTSEAQDEARFRTGLQSRLRFRRFLVQVASLCTRI